MTETSATERIATMLNTVDREAHEKDAAPVIDALRALAPHIARARGAAVATDEHAAAHRQQLAAWRSVLTRPGMDRIKGLDKQRQILAARRLTQDIAGLYENAAAIRREILKCEAVDNVTLETRAGWVTQQGRWLDGLAHGAQTLADYWLKLEGLVEVIATWTPAVTAPGVIAPPLPPSAPARPRFATSSTAPRGAA